MKVQNCDICNGDKIYGKLPQIVQSDVWKVELNPNQQHIGRTFIGLREHKSSVGDLSQNEILEFHRIVTELEIGVRAAFAVDLFNLMCLMNNAVRDSQETHVHWHMVPRYSKPVNFMGHTFTDDAWPRQYNTGQDKPYYPTPDELVTISRAIQMGIKQKDHR